ncbi:MAG: DUF488 domain-containing protein [Anaerolineaceae bacterium]|nr:DUF488 domain-containing protein [Anaerolineaceae bacterium]
MKRIYDPPEADTGQRYFVERLWPRGIKKEALANDTWLKDASPSPQLRQWFSHDPAKWDEFQKKYLQELDEHITELQPLLEQARRGNLILLYSAKDTQHNSALILKAFLEKHLQPMEG